jgi:hypothetical protein
MKFRKKPVAIDAVQWTGDLEAFMRAWAEAPERPMFTVGPDVSSLRLHTLNGDVGVEIGDWVIHGTAPGDFYPCKAAIFPTLFDPVEG